MAGGTDCTFGGGVYFGDYCPNPVDRGVARGRVGRLFDGFGGGTSKEKILAIMKDSHIGCYGTIGLVLYFILYYSLLSSFDPAMIFPIVIAADCFSKLCAAVMVNTLPYVRKEEESKIKLVYSKVRTFIFVIVGLITLIPFFFLKDASFCFAMIPAILTAIGLRFFLKIKIGGTREIVAVHPC